MFGILSYSRSMNIGDEIQSLAAKKLLCSLGCNITYMVDRDTQEIHQLSEGKLKISEPIHVVMNGWFDSNYYVSWPPSSLVDPLIISYHLNDQPKSKDYDCLESYSDMSKKRLDKFNEFWESLKNSIGCRDIHTLDKFLNEGYNAYFSGCLTSTLLPSKSIKFEDRIDIYIVDVDSCEYSKIPSWVLQKAIRETHIFKSKDQTERFKRADYLLDIYQNAYLVVTSRLHVALPCVAFGTPVIFLKSDYMNDCRFDGLIDLIPTFGKDIIPIDFKNHKNDPLKETRLKRMAANIRVLISKWVLNIRTKDLAIDIQIKAT